MDEFTGTLYMRLEKGNAKVGAPKDTWWKRMVMEELNGADCRLW